MLTAKLLKGGNTHSLITYAFTLNQTACGEVIAKAQHRVGVSMGREDQTMCLFAAVQNRNKTLIKLLEEELGVDVASCKDRDGRTAMHIAAKGGADLMIYLLSDHASLIDEPDRQMMTPLHLACEADH